MNDNFALVAQNKQLQSVDPAAVAAAEAAKARIQSAYLMAFHNPRNEDNARILIKKACENPSFANAAEYKKPYWEYDKSSGRTVKKHHAGASIRLAEVALRAWKNVLTDSNVIYEDDNVRRYKIYCTDLESNTTFSKEITVKKTVERKNSKDREVVGERTNSEGGKVFIVRATEDEIQNKEAAMISKALRNEGLRLIPGDIIEEALTVARETQAKEDKTDPQAAKKRLLDAFSGIGIMPSDIEKYLGKKADVLLPHEIADLRAIYAAVRDGESKWSDYMVPPSDVEEKTNSKKEELKSKLRGRHPKHPDPPPVTDTPPAETEMPEYAVDPDGWVECPISKDRVLSEFCASECQSRQGCPSWPAEDEVKI
jgi:hypothetical protein